jgi:hypothetical protein
MNGKTRLSTQVKPTAGNQQKHRFNHESLQTHPHVISLRQPLFVLCKHKVTVFNCRQFSCDCLCAASTAIFNLHFLFLTCSLRSLEIFEFLCFSPPTSETNLQFERKRSYRNAARSRVEQSPAVRLPTP